MAAAERACAPEKFAAWMSTHIAHDKKFGRKVFRYHPRSDEHSKMLCTLVLNDLLASCPPLARHAQQGKVVAGINMTYLFPNAKKKNLDLALGTPTGAEPLPAAGNLIVIRDSIGRLLIACEAKQCMTEHKKTQPRLFDELSSAHEIVHQGDTNTISAGIVVLNIASRFASPTRQVSGEGPLVFLSHRQPAVTESMVTHLRGLKIREKPGETGFDAFATIVIDCDNVGQCALRTTPPAPQPGDPDHYGTFLRGISAAYVARFAAQLDAGGA
jgi:hypothetical protein